MGTESTKLIDNLFRGVCKATETNMKLQQELLLGWTRFWPGFSSRKAEWSETEQKFPYGWSNTMVEFARAQRDLLDHQFESAIAALEVAWGGSQLSASNGRGQERETSPAVVEKEEPSAPPPVQRREPAIPVSHSKNIYEKVAVVTGAASGIGEAVSRELANRGAKCVLLADRSDQVEELAKSINDSIGKTVAVPQIGDTTDESFRKRVFDTATEKYGLVTICVPAAGITRDSLAVRIDKATGRSELYPAETFRQVTEVNLIAPIYWGIEMVARIAEDRWHRGLKRWDPEETVQGVVVFLGSVSSQGNKGQISYAVAKAGLEGAAATLTKEAIFHGVRCGIIHPGFTDTPMARALGQDFLEKNVLPFTQLRRLIRPEEIADAICFMVTNSAVSGELWADAGWHPPA